MINQILPINNLRQSLCLINATFIMHNKYLNLKSYIIIKTQMGNKILGRRSKSFYRGFNERQIDYIKQKFETLSTDGKLDKGKFMQAYKINNVLCDKFIFEIDFDQDSVIDQYQFICMAHSLCSLSIQQLGALFFKILSKGKNNLNQQALLYFTQTCINYNSYMQKSTEKNEIAKMNKNKFQKYDFNKDKTISQQEFTNICLKDEDYKMWMFNMGFITKRQMDYQQDVYDLVDSDIGDQVQRHDKQTKQNVSKLKQGIEHRLDDQQFQIQQVAGQQSAPVQRPWIKQTQKVIIEQENSQPPNQTLTIDYVFGYRSFDCRNNVKFDSAGKIVYHQAAIGIVLNPTKNTQQYIIQHHDDITCLDVVGDTVVTGETGANPTIIVWQTNKQLLANTKNKKEQMAEDSLPKRMIISDQLKDGISGICLSDSKKRLAAICNDYHHRIVVYDLDKVDKKRNDPTSLDRGVIAVGNSTQSIPFDLKFDVSQRYLVLATIKQLLFITFQKGTLNANRGQYGSFSVTAALCLQPLKCTYKGQKKQYIISGMGNGSIYFWQNQTCVKAITGHQGSVSAICGRKDVESFVSGDKGGNIIIWNQKFQKQKTLTAPKTNCPSSMIVALSCSKNKQLLIGTKSSDIYTMKIGDSFDKAKKIVSGHNDGYLWGLAVDQDQNYIYTGGQDRRLMKWQFAIKRTLQKQYLCPYKIRSIDLFDPISKDLGKKQKSVLIVGYKNGVVQIFDPEKLQPTGCTYASIKNPDQQVLNLIKVNKAGTVCLVCYQYPKFKIVMLNLAKRDKKEIVPLGEVQLSSKVIAIDFDIKYQYIRVNTTKFQYLVYKLDIVSASKATLSKVSPDKAPLKRQQWATHTVPFSPETQGLLTDGVMQEDIVCCERSRRYGNAFVVGDKYSKIKLFNFPSRQNRVFNKFVGHSNQVTGIQFNPKQQFVFSIGGPEKSIIVWRYDGKYQSNQKYISKLVSLSEQQDEQTKQQLKRKKKLLQQDQYKVQAIAGEQAGATKPFAGQIKLPDNFKEKYNAKKDNNVPQQDLTMTHVFGLRNKYIADEVRNQVRFSSSFRQVIFPTACLGVKMHIESKKQQFYHAHKQDIVSFAISPDRKIMATGQMAEKNPQKPKQKIVCIYVWDLDGKKILQKLDGFHTIAVVLLEFSPNNKYLYSCGNDSKNSFAIYDWISGTILYSGPTSGSKVNGIAWKTNEQFVTVGMDHVKFWTKGKGQLGKTAQKFQAMVSCVSSKRIYITGSVQGGIYNWTSNKSQKKIEAHSKGKVHTLIAFKDYIYSGGSDGKVLSWKTQANGQIKVPQQIFDASEAYKDMIKRGITIAQQQFGILSIDFSDRGQMIVGTQGASIIYKGDKNAEVIHQGHYKGQLWGLTTHPSKTNGKYILTGGDDKTVRLWDIQQKKELSRYYFSDKIRGIDWSPDGSHIVVGDFRARVYLFDGKDLSSKPFQYTSKLYERNVKQKNPFIQDLKFSPNGKMIAYGCHGQSIQMQILSVEGSKLRKKAIFQQGTSAMLHVDWSTDSSMISVNSQAYQLLFFDENGSKVSASSCKNEEWATWTRKIGFQVKGIFQGVDFSDVNCVCRDPTKSFIAVGYDDQTIRLFKYPAYVQKQVNKQYFGHSSHVTRIKFTNEFMVSLGGLDRTIILWKVERPNINKQFKSQEQDDGLDDLEDDVDLPNKAVTRKPKPKKQQQFYQVQDEGDQFMAVKPWLGAIKQPTYQYPKQTTNKPNAQLVLQYVQGYRTKDCRQNLFWSDDRTIIYHAAAVLIYHDIQKNQQTILDPHQDDILSIDYHKGTNQVLTGQLGPKPLVCLFKDQKLIKKFNAPVKKGVMAVAFSPDGKKAACAGMDDDHHVAVLDLVGGNILKVVKGTKKVITKIIWTSNSTFASIGISHYKLWTWNQKDLTGKQSPKKLNLVSAAYDQQTKKLFTGASKGTIIVWNGNQAQKQQISLTIPAQSKQQQQLPAAVVDCLLIHKNLLLAGTKDGILYVVDKKTKKVLNLIQMQDQFLNSDVSSQCKSLRALDILNDKLLIGTLGSQIYHMKVQDLTRKKKPFSESVNILKCHYSPNNTWTNQVWGLYVQDDYIFTCSDDATVRVWSIKQHKLICCASTNVKFDKNKAQIQIERNKKTKDFEQQSKSRSICVSPDGKQVVVGAKDGTVRVYTFSKNKLKFKNIFKHASQWISDIKFGYNTLAIGSHDNKIYVYNYEQGLIKKKYAPLNKHSSYITHIDISRDSCFLQSTCGAYQLLFWDLNTGKQLPSGASALKDERWTTWTCNLGWPVQGIYPKTTDGTFINAVDRSNSSINNTHARDDYSSPYLLAVGNDNGKVALYNYPCTMKSSNYVQGRGHSSHVTNVRWSKDDKYVISVGGEDQCVMYWRVNKKSK